MAHHSHGHADVASHEGHNQPTVRKYVAIFVILFIITAIEVAASYLTDVGAPVWVEIATLIALAILKGALVVLFYMHLRFDSNWFRFFFISGLILAVHAVVTFILLFGYHASRVD